MTEEIEGDVDHITFEMFNECMEELWRKKGRKYEFIVKGGHDLKHALFCIFNSVWRNEKVPTSWKKTTLIRLFKGKGDFRECSSMRNIHIKNCVQKYFSNIVIRQVQDMLAQNMSIFQIGTKKGHRATEHIYVMKTVLKNMNI